MILMARQTTHRNARRRPPPQITRAATCPKTLATLVAGGLSLTVLLPGVEVAPEQVVRRDAGDDAELDEKVQGVRDLLDELLPIGRPGVVLPGLHVEMAHGLGHLAGHEAVEAVEAHLHGAGLEDAVVVDLGHGLAVALLLLVVLLHERGLAGEDG